MEIDDKPMTSPRDEAAVVSREEHARLLRVVDDLQRGLARLVEPSPCSAGSGEPVHARFFTFDPHDDGC